MSDFEAVKADVFSWVENPDLPVAGIDPAEFDVARDSIIGDRVTLVRTAIGIALLDHDARLLADIDDSERIIAQQKANIDNLKATRAVAKTALSVIDDRMTFPGRFNEKPKTPEEISARRIAQFDYVREHKPLQVSFAGKMKIEEDPFTLWLDPGVDAYEGIDLTGWVKEHMGDIRDLFGSRDKLFSRIASELSFRSSPNAQSRISVERWMKKGVVECVVTDGDQHGIRVESLAEFTHEIPGLKNHGLSSVVALLAIADMQAAERAGILTK